MGSVYFKEVFQCPIKEFKEHLQNDLNERIIFSGKYGAGKTTFIKEFFKDGNQMEIVGGIKYDVCHLFPVNYSIASNEDIIKYIKYDIISELLRKGFTPQEFDLKFIDTLPLFIKQNLEKVAAIMLHMIPKVGKDISAIYDKIVALCKEFEKFHKENNESEGDKMIAYLEKLEETDGGIYENDVITKIISNAIKNIKDQNKQSILIVDDIDRLDPEHIFRILNVFAAHFDTLNSVGNKFGFDKIIIVCDIHNVRNVFHHRYGREVDFMGYIDKFYSSDIYFFDNQSALLTVIGKALSSVKFLAKPSENEHSIRSLYFNGGFLDCMLFYFIDHKFITIRSVLKGSEKIIGYHHEMLNFNQDRKVIAFEMRMAMRLKFLSGFFGDVVNFKNVISACALNQDSIEHFEYHFADLIYCLIYASNGFMPSKKNDFEYKNHKMIVDLTKRDYNGINVRVLDAVEADFKPSVDIFWSALSDVVERLFKIGYLK